MEMQRDPKIAPLKPDTVIIRSRIITMDFGNIIYLDSPLAHDKGWDQIACHGGEVESISDKEDVSLVTVGTVIGQGSIHNGDIFGAPKLVTEWVDSAGMSRPLKNKAFLAKNYHVGMRI